MTNSEFEKWWQEGKLELKNSNPVKEFLLRHVLEQILLDSEKSEEEILNA